MNVQLLYHDAAIDEPRLLLLLACLLFFAHLGALAQTPASEGVPAPMTVWDCMNFAVRHSHSLRQRELTLDNAEASRMQVVGAFLPSLSGSSGVQWNFGRAIDPETNTYTSVSTFNNGYGLSTSIPVFDGFYRLHSLRAARADVLLQKNALQADRDQVALETYQAFTNVAYYQETVRLATEKLHESEMMLRQTQVMEEEGLKSPADVAQMQAQVEADRLTLLRQENLKESGMLKLKEVMNWGSEPLKLDTTSLIQTTLPLNGERGGGHSLLLQSFYNVQAARHNLSATRSAFYPTVYLNAGINSSYYRNLNAANTTAYGRQLKNNLGEYVSMSLSVPLFNRLGNLAALRRAKNNVRIAEEQYEAKRTELDVLRQQALLDIKAVRQECEQGTAKVAADSLAYELTRQQYTEGLASPIDLQTSAATLLQSRASLLQSRLSVGLKEMQRRYYAGEGMATGVESWW